MTEDVPRFPLHLCLFGPFEAWVDGEQLFLKTRPQRELLALLALKGNQHVSRVWLAREMWTDIEDLDVPDRVVLGRLKVALTHIKKGLGLQSGRLDINRTTICLDLKGAFVDVCAFRKASDSKESQDLAEAVSLYRAPFLEDRSEDWILKERDQLADVYFNALERLAEQMMASEAAKEAIPYLKLLTKADPLRESACCLLMQAQATCREYLEVRRVYVTLCQKLQKDELGKPDAKTTKLFQDLEDKRRRLAQRSRDAPSSLSVLKASAMHNLPPSVTEFIGREREVREIKESLLTSQLVTLVGTGGCGKTRLSLKVAEDVLDVYADGVWFIDLATLENPSLVSQTIANVLPRTDPVPQPLRNTIETKQMLLVLDNCEHVWSACIALVNDLLPHCPDLNFLATSRQPLATSGEQIYLLSGLDLPPALWPQGMSDKDILDRVMTYDAPQLFCNRAKKRKPDFHLLPWQAKALADICWRLDGIPLAIELAATHVRSSSLHEINDNLRDDYDLLINLDRAAPPRHQTLQKVFDWSYEKLNIEEQTLLARLSVFRGGWTLDAVNAICSGIDEGGVNFSKRDMRNLLTSLVDKCLVDARTQGESTRYHMLEITREYAKARLKKGGESLIVQARHGNYFLKWAEEVQPKLRDSQQPETLHLLEIEHDNLRQALTFYSQGAVIDEEAGQKGLRLAVALRTLWIVRGHLREGRERLVTALTHSGSMQPTKTRADALNGVGSLDYLQGDYSHARNHYQLSLEIALELNDRSGIAACLLNLGNLAYTLGENAQASDWYKKSLTVFRDLGDQVHTALSLLCLGNVAYNQGEDVQAHKLYEEALTAFRGLQDQRHIALCLQNMGNVASKLGDLKRAQDFFQDSLDIRRKLVDKKGIADCLLNLGHLACQSSNYDQAHSLYEESLISFQQLGDKQGIAYILEAFALLAVHDAQEARSARLSGAAAALRETIASPLSSHELEEQRREMAGVQEKLDETAYALAWSEGRIMTTEQALTYAREKEGK